MAFNFFPAKEFGKKARCGSPRPVPETRELVEQPMNPDAFGGEEAVKDRSKSGLVEQHEAKLRKQDAQSAEGARRQDPQNQQEVQDMPGSGSDRAPLRTLTHRRCAIELQC